MRNLGRETGKFGNLSFYVSHELFQGIVHEHKGSSSYTRSRINVVAPRRILVR